MNKCVAVVILNWNGRKLLETYLPSVVEFTNSSLADVIVVDNGSTDDSVDFMKSNYSQLRTIEFAINYGFAEGYNRAIDLLDYEFIVLLNSDVRVSEKWLEPVIKKFDETPDLGAAQPKIKADFAHQMFEYAGAAGGFIDDLGFPFCRGRIMDTLEEDKGQYDEIMDLFWASGAALFVRRELYIEAGGLDARFFAHMEEIDLCWRIQNLGYRIQVVPQSQIYHLGGGSLPMNHPRKLYLNYRNNLLMLYKNMEKQQHRSIAFKRLIVDSVAAVVFLLKGELKNTKAVIEAYKDYNKMKVHYSPPKHSFEVGGVYKGSIIWGAMIERKRYFSQLSSKLFTQKAVK